jgi:deoxyribodipyrimidine photo-lyase
LHIFSFRKVLALAHKSADFVLPLYCFDPRHFEGTHHYKFPKTGIFRTQFLLESVEDFRKTLVKRGSNLMIVHSKPEEALLKIFKSLTGLKVTLILQTEVTKEETDVEKCLQKICQEIKASYINCWGSTLYHKGDLPFQINHVPDSYTGFRKDVEEKLRIRPEISMPDKMKPVPTFAHEIPWGNLPTIEALNSTKPIPNSSSAFPFNGGETAALLRLKSYLWDTNAVAQYKETRNGLIGSDYSTKFSPWLAHGCLSPRRIHWELEKYELQRTKNQSTYWVRFELLWRDYFKFVSMKYGDRIFYPNGMKGRRQQWKKDMELFKAWQSAIFRIYLLLYLIKETKIKLLS